MTEPLPRLFYIQYTNPARYPPIEHSSRILTDNGWQVVFYGIFAAVGDPIDFAHPRIVIKRMQFCPAGWRQKLHYLIFCAWVFSSVLASRPRWIYASDPLSCPLALCLSWLPGVRVLYHEHDAPDPAQVKGWFQHLVLRTRRALAGRASFCVLPNQGRIERFTSEIPAAKSVLCIWNCPARDEVRPARQSPMGDDLWVVYQGSLVPARLPDTILHAMSQLPPQVKLRVVGYQTIGHPTFLRDYLDLAAKLGLRDRLEIAGAMPRARMLETSVLCHVGISLMPTHPSDPNQQSMPGASNKPFDYLACGLAVLVSDLPDWNAMYVEPGYGLCCVPEDAASIARALRWFYEHPSETRCMGERGRSRVSSEWNYEAQFAPVVQRLREPRAVI